MAILRALACGVREIAIFASASESYSRKNLNRSRDEVIAGHRTVVRRAKDEGLRVRGYLSMVIADPWDGPTPTGVAVDAGQRLLDLGCDELSLGDTIGIGTPGEITTLLAAYRAAGVAGERIGMHLHDTHGQALAHALLAVTQGVAGIAATAGTPEPRTSLSNAGTSVLAICRHFASCASERLPRSAKTSCIAFVGAKSALPTAIASPPILRLSFAG